VSFCAARSIKEVTFYAIDGETIKRVALEQEQRKAIARKAARARWRKAKKS